MSLHYFYWRDTRKKWENPKLCKRPGHNPPSHLVVRGTYEHKCPGCGKVTILKEKIFYL